MPKAINKIQNWHKEFVVEKGKEFPTFEVIIKEDGKVIYHNKAYAGVLNLVQSIDNFDEKELSFEGDSQAFGFGHPCIQFFSLDQLRKKLQPVMVQAMSILSKLTGDPRLKKWAKGVGDRNSIKKKNG